MQKTRIYMRQMVELAALGEHASTLLRVLIFSKQSRLKAHLDVVPRILVAILKTHLRRAKETHV